MSPTQGSWAQRSSISAV